MGRSRAFVDAADEDSGQSRSKRKRTTQNVENVETMASVSGMTDGKKALYHCNYCNKDISGKIRIKCVICSDFNLCIECFSVGAEVYRHKSSHSYRVMDMCHVMGKNREELLAMARENSEIQKGETTMRGDQNPTNTLPQHAGNHVNGDFKWEFIQEI